MAAQRSCEERHHAAPRCLLRLHDRASFASEAGERDWTIRFKRTWNALPPHGIGPFRATAGEPTRRIDHLERVNRALASVPYTSVDEPPRQEFSRKYFFSELEGLDNPPWWIEWKRR